MEYLSSERGRRHGWRAGLARVLIRRRRQRRVWQFEEGRGWDGLSVVDAAFVVLCFPAADYP
jgi:hypothetical protein